MFKFVAPLLVSAAFLSGCAKEKPYEENDVRILNELNGSEFSKADLDICTLEDPCLWVPSVADTPYNVTASRPFWQGDEKLVVTQFSQDKYKILQIEEDGRFAGNINNFSPVAEYTVEHVDYKCEEDSLGKCANKETEDTEKPWQERKRVRLGELTVNEKNSLPIQFDELFSAGCYDKTGLEFLGNKKAIVEKNAINIGTKVSYAANPNCVMIREMDDLRYLNFTVDYNYSLVKLSELADSNYQEVEYPASDESYFGFFKTVQKKKTVDNHDHYMGLRTNLMNRWSPNKKEIVYYLNEDFYKPEMANILQSTKDAIGTVNFSLEKAKAGFRIKLADGRGKNVGDIRNNFLVLVSDPQASGVIGYGPSVVNPRTGEILNARTVMYYGTIQKFIAKTYDALVKETLNQQSPEESDKAAPAQAASSSGGAESSLDAQAAKLSPYFISKAYNASYTNFAEVQRIWNTQLGELFNLRDANFDLRDPVQMSAQLKAFKDKTDRMAKETFFHASHMNFEGAVQNFILERKAFWDDLTEEERARVMEKLLPSVWVPTMVHEFGHNLGLRHNFYGNIDEENYYSASERQALGLKRDVTFSSIMDYTYSTLNELKVMGKYDVAALKFAYAREVETRQGSSLTVDSTLTNLLRSNEKSAKDVKRFKYCSDEHVGNDPLCNRFDEGKTHAEVVSHYIKTYNENYSKRNFRNRKYDFSGRYGDWSYAISAFNTLGEIRQFFDLYDQRVFRGDYDKDAASEQKKKELEDVKQASDLAFDALMNVVETPAYHCLELFVKDGQIAGVGEAKTFNEMARGTKLEEYGITFDIANGCEYLSYFESQNPSSGLPAGVSKSYLSFGKYFNNSLDISISSDQKMDNDTSQIDVRGYWIDKVIASIFLTSRSQSPTTIGAASNGSFLDYQRYEERFSKFLKGFLTNKFKKEIEVKMGERVIGKLPVTYKFDDNHLVNKSYNYQVNHFFNLGHTQNHMKMVMMKPMKENFSVPRGPTDFNRKLLKDYSAVMLASKVDVSLSNYDKVVEFNTKNGDVRFGLYNYNAFGMKLAESKEALDKIEGLSQESAATLMDTVKAISEAQGQDEIPSIIGAVEDEAVLDILINHNQALADYRSGHLTEEGLITSFLALSEIKHFTED